MNKTTNKPVVLDLAKRKGVANFTVNDLISVLKNLPHDAKVYCCGNNQFFMHVSDDNKIVIIDNNTFDEVYFKNEKGE